jgi:hypothetical protein
LLVCALTEKFLFINKIFRVGSEDPVFDDARGDSGAADDPVVSQSLAVEGDVVDPPCFRGVV